MLQVLLAACGAPTFESVGSDSTPGLPATVERVVDGDTIIVSVNGTTETVRLLGIDTPEKPGGPRPAECFGAEATQFARELLPEDTQVSLTRDVETRDQFGRLLAFVHRSRDDLFVNMTLVEQGFATSLFFAPNTSHRAQFDEAAASARRAWIGFWPACGAPNVVLMP